MFAAQNILLCVKGGKHLVDTFQCHLQHTESDENSMADPFPRHPAAVGGRLKTGISHRCWTVSDEKAWKNGSISSSVHHFFGTLQIIEPKWEADWLNILELRAWQQSDLNTEITGQPCRNTWHFSSRFVTFYQNGNKWESCHRSLETFAFYQVWLLKCRFLQAGKKKYKKRTLFSCKVLTL